MDNSGTQAVILFGVVILSVALSHSLPSTLARVFGNEDAKPDGFGLMITTVVWVVGAAVGIIAALSIK